MESLILKMTYVLTYISPYVYEDILNNFRFGPEEVTPPINEDLASIIRFSILKRYNGGDISAKDDMNDLAIDVSTILKSKTERIDKESKLWLSTLLNTIVDYDFTGFVKNPNVYVGYGDVTNENDNNYVANILHNFIKQELMLTIHIILKHPNVNITGYTTELSNAFLKLLYKHPYVYTIILFDVILNNKPIKACDEIGGRQFSDIYTEAYFTSGWLPSNDEIMRIFSGCPQSFIRDTLLYMQSYNSNIRKNIGYYQSMDVNIENRLSEYNGKMQQLIDSRLLRPSYIENYKNYIIENYLNNNKAETITYSSIEEVYDTILDVLESLNVYEGDEDY
ncbi:Hypothetical protein ORPV_834 [Orpheovirus IHUMI-LCC2]|uniref:Uncharacterized protein n=1 Tax=Orpheovirus IHUMI-LCC2 TaxID=2023057 RepID=A0A2I2L5B4_9VIRU|nr:Hypothetical protein ORPV_834 [Orpheovirus IHUMI-LCC2]SNW62738.1 Hypothetical protein ORPV_834 [Orpheovirus IHUMI-LCC2]